MSIISEMLKHNISFHFKYGCWTRRRKNIPKIPIILFFLCHAIFMTALIMKQGNHSSEVIDKVAFMETYQDREAP